MLETVSKHNMVHFSEDARKTIEDIVYYINPPFIANGWISPSYRVSRARWDK